MKQEEQKKGSTNLAHEAGIFMDFPGTVGSFETDSQLVDHPRGTGEDITRCNNLFQDLQRIKRFHSLFPPCQLKKKCASRFYNFLENLFSKVFEFVDWSSHVVFVADFCLAPHQAQKKLALVITYAPCYGKDDWLPAHALKV